MLLHIQLERVVGLAAAAVPIIAHFVGSQYFQLVVLVSAGIDGVRVGLFYTARAFEALLGQQFDVLSNCENRRGVNDAPELRRNLVIPIFERDRSLLNLDGISDGSRRYYSIVDRRF